MEDNTKSIRVLDIYSRLIDGDIVRKSEIAKEYGVNERTIQRDFECIRSFLGTQTVRDGIDNDLIYDHSNKGYKLEHIYRIKLSNEEVLAICKILLDSRAFTKATIQGMLSKLIECCVPKENQKMVKNLIRNEEFHYIPPQHNSDFLQNLWLLGQAINECKVIEIGYRGLKGNTLKTRIVEPLAIMFSEYYFYLAGILRNIDKKVAFSNPNDPFPTIYRIDRIKKLKVLKEHYKQPYNSRFEEGEYRKRIQFMFGGELRRIEFECSDWSIESVLDRLPTAKILSENNGKYIVQAEVFGDGVDMWIRSQGDKIKLIKGETKGD